MTNFINEKEKNIEARVISVHKDRYGLSCKYGDIYGRLKKSVYYNSSNEEFPTVGDFVQINYNESGDSQIVKTDDRKSKFSRNNFSGHAAGYVKTVKEQVIAANFDYVFIMASLNYDFNVKRIERYLTIAWQSGATPLIILTKADLVDNYSEQLKALEKIAEGVEIVALSSKTGYGIENLSPYLKPGNTIVFLGSSGVGKSSLVNAISGEEVMLVSEIREDDSRGKHTTTHRQLITLNNGVMIIDTPGMRELGVWEVESGIDEAFSDVEVHIKRCRFSNCSHKGEPGCAVAEALSSGELSRERWKSYMKIKNEANFVKRKCKK